MTNERQFDRLGRGECLEIGAALLFAALAIGYSLFRSFIAPNPEVDFRFYWFAGYMWAHGLDPYSPAFRELGNSLLPPGSDLQYWFYPPQWWPFSRLLALFDFPTALKVWHASLALILAVTTAVVVGLLTRGLRSSRRLMFIAGACALAMTIEATADVIAGGQVSPVLVYAGMALLICSFLSGSEAALVAGLVLVSLKPQVGLLVFAAFALSPRHWRAIACALAAILVFALPQLLAFGPVTTLQEMIANYRGFNSIAGNVPLAMTGPAHLLARLDVEIPLSASYALAFATAIAGGLLLYRNTRSLEALALLIAGIAAFVPLHNYDMALVVLVAAVLLKLNPSRTGRVLIAAILLLSIRPSRIEALFAVPVHLAASGGVILYSAASLVLFALAVRRVIAVRAATGEATETFLSAAVTGRSTSR